MRPKTEESRTELYECFDCGERYSGVSARVCDNCGGELNNLGRSRDL